MLIGTVQVRSIPSPSSLFLLESADLRPRQTRHATPVVVCNSHRESSSIPKLEPFSRSKIDRRMKDPSFIQKSENELTNYCCILEGDESYSCWKAYFELKDLEKEMPKDDVEKFLRQAGGKKNLIDCLHGVTAMQEKEKNKTVQKSTHAVVEEHLKHQCPIPDGLPKTKEELEEEESARMPESPFTRLLRSKGKHPAWFSAVPDHETD